MEFAANNIMEKAQQESTERERVLHLLRSAWQPGMIVVYVLREDQYATHPQKEWRGKVMHFSFAVDALVVEILNRGYEGLKELVYLKQVVRVESEQDNT